MLNNKRTQPHLFPQRKIYPAKSPGRARDVLLSLKIRVRRAIFLAAGPRCGSVQGQDALLTGETPFLLGTQSACRVLPLSPREERVGRESERGEIDKKRLYSPALSSFFEEERERRMRLCAQRKTFAEHNWRDACPTLLAASPRSGPGNSTFPPAICNGL